MPSVKTKENNMSRTRTWVKTVSGLLALFPSILLSGCSGPATDEAGSKKTAPVEKATNAAAQSIQPSNLQLVLDGPFAIQERISGQPGKIRILIPKAKNHFSPGFDADLNQQLLCQGDFSIDLGKHNPPSMASQIETKSLGNTIAIDTVGIGSIPKSGLYITVLVDSPDQIALMSPTTVTRIGDGNGGGGEYASKVLLRYTGVDPTTVAVKKLTGGPSCTVTLFTILPPVQKTYMYPWAPDFVPVGCDARLQLSMVPSVKEDANHTHAKSAYMAIAKMLGIKRTVDFPSPREMGAGPHNDCRAPLIRVRPLEEAK
jgi:hypothetical protein